MLPDRVLNPGPLTYKSGALPIALRGPALHRLNDGISVTSFYQALFSVYGSKAFKYSPTIFVLLCY